jgi:hypothetical protein
MIKTTDSKPSALDVSLPVGEVAITVQHGMERASVVLEPIREGDEEAVWMIENAQIITVGEKLVVKVPEKPGSGGGMVIQNGGSLISVGRSSVVMGSGNITIRNGVVVSGSVVQIGSSGVRAKIAIPSDVRAKVRGESTDVRVVGMLAALDVRTTNGNIGAGQHQEEVDVESTNGSIYLESVGQAEVHTTNGGITVQRVLGKTRLRATNGSIEATTQTDKFTARTTNGSCTVVADGVDLDDDAVRTTNGRRRLIRR